MVAPERKRAPTVALNAPIAKAIANAAAAWSLERRVGRPVGDHGDRRVGGVRARTRPEVADDLVHGEREPGGASPDVAPHRRREIPSGARSQTSTVATANTGTLQPMIASTVSSTASFAVAAPFRRSSSRTSIQRL